MCCEMEEYPGNKRPVSIATSMAPRGATKACLIRKVEIKMYLRFDVDTLIGFGLRANG